jgi:hypothetical protein
MGYFDEFSVEELDLVLSKKGAISDPTRLARKIALLNRVRRILNEECPGLPQRIAIESIRRHRALENSPNFVKGEWSRARGGCRRDGEDSGREHLAESMRGTHRRASVPTHPLPTAPLAPPRPPPPPPLAPSYPLALPPRPPAHTLTHFYTHFGSGTFVVFQPHNISVPLVAPSDDFTQEVRNWQRDRTNWGSFIARHTLPYQGMRLTRDEFSRLIGFEFNEVFNPDLARVRGVRPRGLRT